MRLFTLRGRTLGGDGATFAETGRVNSLAERALNPISSLSSACWCVKWATRLASGQSCCLRPLLASVFGEKSDPSLAEGGRSSEIVVAAGAM